MRLSLLMLLVALMWPAGAKSQEDDKLEKHIHVGVGGVVPHTRLPGTSTRFGPAQGELEGGVLARLGARGALAWPGIDGFVELNLFDTSVDWIGGGGNTVSGSVWTATTGFRWTYDVSSAVTLYAKSGIGAHVYRLQPGACIPEDPSCGLSFSYADNPFDAVLQIATGAEMGEGDVSLWIEAGNFISRFDVGKDRRTVQSFPSLMLGIAAF